MNLTKTLWAALTGCLSIIVLMASAWAHDTNERGEQFDRRISINEQHYAAIEADLQDLREHVKELKEMLKEQQRAGR